MQIHNFYSDMVPTVRSPLDSIVLSPHTIKHDAFNLNAVDADSCDYQTVLPSISSCKYYDQDSCRKSNTVPKKIWRMFCVLLRKAGLGPISKSKNQNQGDQL